MGVTKPTDCFDLSEEVMIQILARLSTKSIFRMKVACKRWQFLFQSSFFLEKHLNLVEADATNHYVLINQNITPIDSTLPLGLLSTSTKQIVDIKDAPLLCTDGEYLSTHVRGPVNGIYCISIEYNNCDEGFIFWSPGCRQLHVLPPCPLEESEESEPFTGIGFGYDSSKNNYKVIAMQEIDMYTTYFYLYDLAANTWKELNIDEIIDDSLKKNCTRKNREFHWDQYVNRYDGVYLNGSCHWGVGGAAVLSFDMATEVFRLSSEPGITFRGWAISLLTIVHGCLAVICVAEPEGIAISQKMSRVFDVCLMKEYGVEESWTRAYTVTLASPSPGRFLGIIGNEFFVLENQETNQNENENKNKRSKVVSYQLGDSQQGESYEYCRVQWPSRDFGGQRIFPYRETTISVKPNTVNRPN